jgi:hypothetical protein
VALAVVLFIRSTQTRAPRLLYIPLKAAIKIAGLIR